MSPQPPTWVGFDGEVVQPENTAVRLTAELEGLKRRFEQGYVSEAVVSAELCCIRRLAAESGLEPWRPNPTLAPMDIRFRPIGGPAPSLVAPQPVQPEPSVAMREVLSCQQRWIADLPIATTLLVSTHEGGRLLLTTSRAAYAAAQEAQVPAFVGSEISALALAAEHHRASPGALQAWCAEKLREPGFRVTEFNALDMAEPRGAELGWTVDQVLQAFNARLEAVCMGQDVPW